MGLGGLFYFFIFLLGLCIFFNLAEAAASAASMQFTALIYIFQFGRPHFLTVQGSVVGPSMSGVGDARAVRPTVNVLPSGL